MARKFKNMCESSPKPRTINYDQLMDGEIEDIRRHTLNKFSTNYGGKFFGLFGNLFDYNKEKAIVNDKVYDIIDYITENGLDHIGIFRISGNYKRSAEVAEKLIRSEDFVIDEYDINSLASGLKKYLKNGLNGLIPMAVWEGLVITCCVGEEIIIDDELLKCLPFALEKDKRKLLLAVFDMIREIDLYSHINLMHLDNLMTVFPPSLFPQASQKTPGDYLMQKKIIKKMVYLDFTNVPIELINRKK